VESDLRSSLVEHEPPGVSEDGAGGERKSKEWSVESFDEPERVSTSRLRRCRERDSRSSNVSSNDQVPEEEPSADEGILRASGRHSHDRVVGSVESKSSSGKSIGNDVL